MRLLADDTYLFMHKRRRLVGICGIPKSRLHLLLTNYPTLEMVRSLYNQSYNGKKISFQEPTRELCAKNAVQTYAFQQMNRQPKWKHVLIKSWKVFAWVCMDVSLYTFEFAFNILYFINRKELNLETVLVGSVALTFFYSCPVSEVSGTCLTRTNPEDLLAQQVWKNFVDYQLK